MNRRQIVFDVNFQDGAEKVGYKIGINLIAFMTLRDDGSHGETYNKCKKVSNKIIIKPQNR